MKTTPILSILLSLLYGHFPHQASGQDSTRIVATGYGFATGVVIKPCKKNSICYLSSDGGYSRIFYKDPAEFDLVTLANNRVCLVIRNIDAGVDFNASFVFLEDTASKQPENQFHQCEAFYNGQDLMNCFRPGMDPARIAFTRNENEILLGKKKLWGIALQKQY